MLNKFQSILAILLLIGSVGISAQDRELEIWRGTTPQIDGIISENEYSDATSFKFDSEWYQEYGLVTDSLEYSIKGWAKHDGTNLFIAFDVTDSVIYGYDIPRWLPTENALANALDMTNDWPYWGDAIEIFLSTTNKFTPTQSTAGNGFSWNVVCNTHKSRLGQLDSGGLIEGYPRTTNAFNKYKSWIENGDMVAKVKLKESPEPRGYIIEWKINANPCLEIAAGSFWHPTSKNDTMRINFEPEDVDRKEDGDGWANMVHVIQYSGRRNYPKAYISNWAMLIIHPNTRNVSIRNNSLRGEQKVNLYPNPSADGRFMINLSSQGNANVKIFSIIGTQVYNKNFEASGNLSINSQLDKGIYLIVVNANGSKATGKMVIR